MRVKHILSEHSTCLKYLHVATSPLWCGCGRCQHDLLRSSSFSFLPPFPLYRCFWKNKVTVHFFVLVIITKSHMKSDSLFTSRVSSCLKRTGTKWSWMNWEVRNQAGGIPGSRPSTRKLYSNHFDLLYDCCVLRWLHGLKMPPSTETW